MKYHVLIVEDETTLLRGLLRGLQSMANVHLTGCTHVREALESVDRDPPDVLITDLNLPDRNGIELLAELQTRGLRIPVIITTAYNTEYGSELSRHPDLTLLEKPVSIQQLRKVLEEKLQQAATWAPIGPFKLIDYLQLAGYGRHSVQLSVEMDDRQRGSLQVVQGNIWNAAIGHYKGREALNYMLQAGIKNLACRAMDVPPKQRQIEDHWEEILLDLARLNDEQGREEEEQDDFLSFSDDFFAAVGMEKEAPQEEVQEQPVLEVAETTSKEMSFQILQSLASQQWGRAKQVLLHCRERKDVPYSAEPWVQLLTASLS